MQQATSQMFLRQRIEEIICRHMNKKPGFLLFVLYLTTIPFSVFGNNEVVEKWHKKELVLISSRAYDNPIYEVTFFGAEFISPSGTKYVVRGFWDGSSSWKVRFMPNQTGRWRYRTICSDQSNDGLNEIEGTFHCIPTRNKNEIYKRGLLKHPEMSYHLTYDDGKPFLYIGCTAWNGGLLSTPEEWEQYLSNRKANGYSVIQLVTTQWRGATVNAENETAFSGTDSITINPSFFRRLDARIDRINDYGLIAAPVMLWAYGNSNPGSSLPVGSATKLAEYILARYDANHVIWNLGGDGYYLKENEERWKHIGRSVFGENDHHNIVTLHPRGLSWYGTVFNDESWLDMISYQTGHANSKNVVSWKTEGPVVREWETLIPRPMLDTEPVYENGHNAKEVRNSAYWSIFSTPVAGVSYGSHTIWPWLRKGDKPINHGEKEPSPISWFDALSHDGSIQTGNLGDFFRTFDWWKLYPANHLLKEQPGLLDYREWQMVLATPDRSLILVYIPLQGVIQLSTINTKHYSARWFDTERNKYVKVKMDPNNNDLLFRSPVQSDAVLILSKKK